MATFECPVKKNENNGQALVKYPIKRLESTINRFIRILRIDLERLNKHKHNIEKVLQEWNKVNTEQINASRTVQQLKANIRALEQTRNQVEDEDADQFERLVSAMHQEAVNAVVSFLQTSGVQVPQTHRPEATPGAETASKETQEINHKVSAQQRLIDDEEHATCNHEPTVVTGVDQMYARPANSPASESWEHLQESLWELSFVMREFSGMVHRQQETVDSIEDNVETAYEDVQTGVSNLAQASKLKAAILPVTGALIGGVLGGPVGLFAGAKVGSLAAVAGGIAGFTGGRYFKSVQQNAVDREMENLSVNDEISSSRKKPPDGAGSSG